MKLKGYIIKESGAKVVQIDSSGIYKVKSSGDIFEHKYSTMGATTNVVVNSWNDLVKLNKKEVVDFIEHKETKERISELKYLDLEKELLSKRVYDEEEYQHTWESLDDEFNYRKFIASYDRVFKTVYFEEEVLIEEIKDVVLETDNPFIKSGFVLGEGFSNFNVYTYLRPQAVMQIVRDKMKSLGAEYLGEASGFTDKTEGKLAWTTSTHSGIRYAKFAGRYLFSDSWNIKSNRRGTLEQTISYYEEDKKLLESIIDEAYLREFGKYECANTKAITGSLNKLDTAINRLWEIKASVKTIDKQSSCNKLLKDVKELLLSTLKV